MTNKKIIIKKEIAAQSHMHFAITYWGISKENSDFNFFFQIFKNFVSSRKKKSKNIKNDNDFFLNKKINC